MSLTALPTEPAASPGQGPQPEQREQLAVGPLVDLLLAATPLSPDTVWIVIEYAVVFTQEIIGLPLHATANYGTPDDETYVLGPVIPRGLRLDSARLCIDWKDQGWGNAKGRVYLVLQRPKPGRSTSGPQEPPRAAAQPGAAAAAAGAAPTRPTAGSSASGAIVPSENDRPDSSQAVWERVATAFPPWGVAKHVWAQDTCEIAPPKDVEDSEHIFHQARSGDRIEIRRSVGGGGGHQLFVRSFDATFVYGLDFHTSRMSEHDRRWLEAPAAIIGPYDGSMDLV